MEDKKKLLLVGAVVVALLLGAIVFFMMQEEDGEDIAGEDNVPGEERNDPFKGAPRPWVDEEELDQMRDLWPDAFDQKKVDREEVKKEWQEFAEVYPDNVYIPSRFLPEQSDEQKKEQRQLLDQVTSIQTRIASSSSSRKNIGPGASKDRTPAADPGKGDVTPEEQTLYFNEQLKELNSRKQLIQYAMDKKALDPDQISIAKSDLAQIEKEIANIKEVMAQIPGS